MLITQIYKSKLSYTAYPLANPADWIDGAWWLLDPVFAGRIAYYASKTLKRGQKIHLTEGLRSTATQQMYYNEYLEYKRTNKLGPHNIRLAAKPGTSWHEFHLAIDTNTYPLRGTTNAVLKKYGLCKPIKSEGWHLQPIETMGKSSSTHNTYMPVDMAPQFKIKFNLGDETVDFFARYQYGSQLVAKLINGEKKFSVGTIKYLMTYQWWESLRDKLGLIMPAGIE